MTRESAQTSRLPARPCADLPNLLSAEIEGDISKILDSDLAQAKRRRLIAESRLKGVPYIETLSPADFAADRLPRGIADLLLAGLTARTQAHFENLPYLKALVEWERLIDDCTTPEYVSVEVVNEIESNQWFVTALTSEAATVRMLMRENTVVSYVAAQSTLDRKLADERSKSPAAMKARARVEALRKAAETPALRKSRQEFTSGVSRLIRAG